jgi:hypothetical protein
VGWIIPIIFYLTQKASVRTAVQNAFALLKNEFDDPVRPSGNKASATDADQISALAKLRDQGLLSEEEFAAKKRMILGLGLAE